MRKIFLPLVLVYFSVALFGCVKVVDKKEKARSQAQIKNKGHKGQDSGLDSASEEFRLLATKGYAENGSDHLVRIERSSALGDRLLKIVDGESKGYVDWPNTLLTFDDDQVESGTEVEYVLLKISGDEVARVSLFILPDMVIEDEVHLEGDTSWELGRLILGEGAKIITHEHALNIRAQILDVRGAYIGNFLEGTQAKAGYPARAGGAIALFANEASGDLSVGLSGEIGAPGAPGELGDDKLLGAEGKRGASGYLGWDKRKGRAPQISRTCSLEPSDGQPGAKGKTGFAGGTGATGGDSGSLIVDIEKDNGLRIVIHETPGAGGEGGIGGAGGKGGSGGPPGHVFRFNSPKEKPVKQNLYRCYKAKPGPNGAVGDQGAKGIVGAPGSKGKVCLRLKAGGSFECRQE